MIAETFEFSAAANAGKAEQLPWNDLSLLLTPEAEDSLILPEKPVQALQSDFTSPLEALLTPMSSVISPELELAPKSEDLLFGGSPLFDGEIEDPNTWESLFNDVAPEPSVEETGLHLPIMESVLEEISIKPEVISPVTPATPSLPVTEAKSNKRKREEVTASEYKKDALGITAYNRKPRSAPLAPIIIDECDGDSVDAKRARNTAAARRSRARKLERMSQLEEKVQELLALNSALQTENSELRTGMSELRKLCGLE